MINARFMIWYNDQYTKITLKPGQTISLRNFRYHDEGYSERIETYSYASDEPIVYSEYEGYSRDCDGPYELYSESHFVVDQNYSNVERNELETDYYVLDRHVPKWIKGKSSQRDVYAEMMGY